LKNLTIVTGAFGSKKIFQIYTAQFAYCKNIPATKYPFIFACYEHMVLYLRLAACNWRKLLDWWYVVSAAGIITGYKK
jgi:hypothetical protein